MLRGINVSGQKKIRMKELKSLYESLNLLNVETYIQSGNIVFDSTESNPQKIAGWIEAQIKRSFDFEVPVLIRGRHDLKRTLGSNPFLTERNEDPAKLSVIFLQDIPSESNLGHPDHSKK